MGKLSVKIGEIYGRLTVVSREPDKMRGRPVFLCRCACGKESSVWACALRSGNTRSCGCLLIERGKVWAPVMSRKFHKRPPGAAALTAVFSSNRAAAAKRGLTFRITEAEFYALSQQACHYCGAPPANRKTAKGSGDFVYNGVDRVENAIGYEKSNLVPCCFTCNKAKWNRSAMDFLSWAERTYTHLNQTAR